MNKIDQLTAMKRDFCSELQDTLIRNFWRTTKILGKDKDGGDAASLKTTAKIETSELNDFYGTAK